MKQQSVFASRSLLHDLTCRSTKPPDSSLMPNWGPKWAEKITKMKSVRLLWLSLHRWPECLLLGCSWRLGFGFQSGGGLFSFGLQGFEAQDLAVLVTLVQCFELVNEGGGTVSFEAFISEKRSIVNRWVCMYQRFASIIGLIKTLTHPFLLVAIPTSVSFIPTPENHKHQTLYFRFKRRLTNKNTF